MSAETTSSVIVAKPDSRLLIGTSGYSYPDWIGAFYPSGTSPSEMLAFYSKNFAIVELNFSYYKMPSATALRALALAANSVNQNFSFVVKACQTLTHTISSCWSTEAAAFVEALQGLRISQGNGHQLGDLSANQAQNLDLFADTINSKDTFVSMPVDNERPQIKPSPNPRNLLASVLLQFPFSFHYTVQNRRHLGGLLSYFEGLPVAVEFRNAEWLQPRVFSEFTARDVALVSVDEPDLEGLLPRKIWTTSKLGYVRFHGRNRDAWWRGDNASRYDYLYSEDELKEWMPRLSELMAFTQRTLAFFNNHWKGKATVNAKLLGQLLNKFSNSAS